MNPILVLSGVITSNTSSAVGKFHSFDVVVFRARFTMLILFRIVLRRIQRDELAHGGCWNIPGSWK